ncbi:MAG: MerR family transcriptional regulator [Bdellovibrionaceae bacterium]|nr:MerR family transcriptional regulator [Pseudobdellovibrionaceae bacterium]
MLSVGRFAKMAKVSARTIRYYESIGLLPSPSRGENNYRCYNHQLLERMTRIRDLQSLGFGLEEIKTIISFSSFELNERLHRRLLEMDREFGDLQKGREQIVKLLSVSEKIESGRSIDQTERNLYMEAFKEEIIKGLKDKYSQITESQMQYLERDRWFYTHPHMGEFIGAVKKCVAFAKGRNLILGPGRGSSPSSITLFGLGFSSVDPMKYNMIPERLTTQPPSVHIDVEYERGQEFVDFCREINKTLSFGEIQAFKMPLIDVVQNVHKNIGKIVDYNAIDENSDIVLNHFRSAEIEKIFQFDFSKDALVMKYEGFLSEYLGLGKITEYLKGLRVDTFRDIINITSLWRPFNQEMVSRLEFYRKAKMNFFSYDFLSEDLKNSLKPNFGRVLYHEDLLRIIAYYTKWELSRCNSLRKQCSNRIDPRRRDMDLDWIEFDSMAPRKVVDLVGEECKWAFCFPHAVSFAQFTKQTAVLKTLHKKAYFSEIEKFEQKHGITWDDIGFRIKGVSLHQG